MAMKSPFAALLILALCWSGPSSAATKLIHATGRAAIANNDIAGARKGALAEALYDAAGQVRMVVRGSSLLSEVGTIHEESGMAVSGLLKGYEVVEEHREGAHYVVTIDALAEMDDGECASTKKAELVVGGLAVRIAPGIRGAAERDTRESIEGLIETLRQRATLHVVDDRKFNPSVATNTSVSQNMGYLSLVSGHTTNPGGYTLTGTIRAEITRSNSFAVEENVVEITADLQLVDNATHAVKDVYSHSANLPLGKHVWGIDVDIPQQNISSFEALWSDVADWISDRVGCDSLRAVVTGVSAGRVTLSAGAVNGIKAGDVFLVELPSGGKNAWQVLRVDQVSSTQSVARLMKPKPAILPNSEAVLLQ
jgi:Flagellar assembly protein T, N-terminal domain